MLLTFLADYHGVILSANSEMEQRCTKILVSIDSELGSTVFKGFLISSDSSSCRCTDEGAWLGQQAVCIKASAIN
jgi:hypothetical protein